MMQKAIQIHPKDNVAVALQPLKKGEILSFADVRVTLAEDIEQGHKFALYDLPENTNIIKYGTVIGHTTKPVSTGCHVHVENIKTNLGDLLEYTYTPERFDQPAAEGRTFQGFVRKNGDVGIRNEIW
ncbi:MAG: altronate dehydratase, partial [Solobacterium sp.]|nr:altronate dehydratase [Solobacterium sp.]